MNKISQKLLSIARNRVFSQERVFLGSFSRPTNVSLSENQKLILREPVEWPKIRSHLLETNRHVNSVNVDGLILSFYASDGNITAAKSYLQFLQQTSALSLFLRLGLFKVFAAASQKTGYSLTSEDQAFILQVYKEFQEKYEHFDSSTCDNLIHGLALTDQWRNCLGLLEQAKLTAKPTRASYSAIVLAALRANDESLALSLLGEVVKAGMNPASNVLRAWFLRSPESLERLLAFLAENEILISRWTVQGLKEVPFIRNFKETKIDKR